MLFNEEHYIPLKMINEFITANKNWTHLVYVRMKLCIQMFFVVLVLSEFIFVSLLLAKLSSHQLLIAH